MIESNERIDLPLRNIKLHVSINKYQKCHEQLNFFVKNGAEYTYYLNLSVKIQVETLKDISTNCLTIPGKF